MPVFDVKQKAMELNGQLVQWRRTVHATPEVGFNTAVTEKFIVDELKKIGVTDIQHGGGRRGVVALIKGKKEGRVLGIRADYDALNMTEDTGLPFAATNGNMHACGHDGHAAILLGTAKLLMEAGDQLKGTVKLIFQPSEEDGKGAPAMIEDGVFENPPLDGIIGLHAGSLWKGFKSGEAGYRFGALMAASDWFTVTFEGKGGHGATPHLTVDPVAMACQAVNLLQMVVSREVSPLDAAVITVGTISGGTMPNIIAPSCTIRGTIRSLSPETRKHLEQRLRAICTDVAQALRGKAEISFTYGPPPLVNDREMTEKVKAAMEDILGPDLVHEVEEPTMGGEDMAFFQEKVPGSFFFLPATFGDDRDYPHHHPKFDMNEDVFWIGTAVMVQFALTWQ
ncbi:MAG: amidohydrolase [Synergistaceae bacterium]|nr:amidohydrolase [Synergistaceae bacterium]